MQPGWCLICGSTRANEFARKDADRFANRLSGQDRAVVRFVICEACGHVYQDPILDADDLERLYTDDYRPFFKTETALAKEIERGRAIGDDLAPLAERRTQGRTVLDIGCGSGSLLAAFKERGWQVFGIDPVPAWTEFARRLVDGTDQTIVTGQYGPESFPGRRFSLILFSHTVEHIPDPIPMLRTMHRHLAEDGLLFVAAPDLLQPPSKEKLFRGHLAGAHVRLYSRRALRTVLARSGFRTEASLFFQSDYGQGIIVRPMEGVPDQPVDDAAAVHALYRGLGATDSPDFLGYNLAAIARRQRVAIEALCMKVPDRHVRLEPGLQGGFCLLVTNEDGVAIPVVRSGELDGFRPVDVETDQCSLPEGATLVQLGLGSGELAMALAGRLRQSQHLVIWEADAALAKAVLMAVDLSPLWASAQVTLLVGRHVHLMAAQRRRMMSLARLFVTASAGRWNRDLYQGFIDLLGVQEPQPVAVASVTGRTN
ncbi:MAG: class I SAM-dependent methyltransferase [Nitrospirae bacterium]|nr:MAG: class I SAM-dependent methyltransferase [Nitrospirota bacterium]